MDRKIKLIFSTTIIILIAFIFSFCGIPTDEVEMKEKHFMGNTENSSNGGGSQSVSGSITIYSPYEDAQYIIGSNMLIEWYHTDDNVNSVKIELFKDDAFDSVIANSVNINSDGDNDNIIYSSYSWTIPSDIQSGYNYFIKITDNNDADNYGNSGVFSIVDEILNIHMLSHNGALDYYTGQTTNIQWSYTGSIDNVEIALYKNDSLYRTISNSVSSSLNGYDYGDNGYGYYEWTIPDNIVAGYDYKIRITYIDNTSIYDESGYPFGILDGSGINESLSLINPNGGESYFYGDSLSIQWDYTGFINNVKLELYKNGVLEEVIADSISAHRSGWNHQDGSGYGYYYWTIPTSVAEGTDYTVIISDASDSTVNDVSDNTFSIESSNNNDDGDDGNDDGTKSITVLSPNGGESYLLEESITIEWEFTGDVNYFGVHIYKDNTYVNTLDYSVYVTPNNDGTPTIGSVSWTIPYHYEVGGGYYIVVSSNLGNDYIYDASDNTFNIGSNSGDDDNGNDTQDSLVLHNPNGNEVFNVRDSVFILWSYEGSVSNVKLELFNDGQLDTTIADNLPVDNDSDDVSQDILSQMGLSSSILNNTNYGFYEWIIPNNFTQGTSYTIKVSDVSDSTLFDESDNNFTILNNHSNDDID